MPWTAPADPVAGTVITVAYAVTNILDPLRWLRIMTGNADPPGSSYVPVSSSTSAVAWAKVPGDALAPAAATTNLGYTPVNRAGDTMTGTLTVPNLSSTGVVAATGNVTSSGSIAATGNVSAGANITTATGTIQGAAVNATTLLSAAAATITTSITAASGNVSGTLTVGNVNATSISATSNIVSSAGSISAAGNVSAGANITTATGTIQGAEIQATSNMHVGASQVWHAGIFPQPTPTPGPNRVPMSDGSGTLDAWVTSGGGGGTVTPIPPGLIAFVVNAGSIPTGWTRYTPADGRFIVAAGSSGLPHGATFGENSNVGASDWEHGHSIASLSVTVSTFSGTAVGGPGDTTGGPSSTNGVASGPGNAAADNHTHGLNGVSFAVTGSGAGSTGATNSGGTTWIPPARSLVCVQKL